MAAVAGAMNAPLENSSYNTSEVGAMSPEDKAAYDNAGY